jgi:hypothetical protein
MRSPAKAATSVRANRIPLLNTATLTKKSVDPQASNRLDSVVLAIDVADRVAMAQFNELSAQSHRLAELVDHREIDKQEAVDMLYVAAVASNLVGRHGNDEIQAVIAEAFA